MKVCDYCGSECEEKERVCPSCGGDSFKAKCHNCGTVFDSAACPNCGVKAGDSGKVCPECGTRYFSNACPNCGYTPLRRPAEPAYAAPTQAPYSRSGCNTVLWIFGWMLLFPVPLTIVILRNRNLQNWLKAFIIVAAWLVYLIFAFTAKTEGEKEGTGQTSSDYVSSFVSESSSTPQSDAVAQSG